MRALRMFTYVASLALAFGINGCSKENPRVTTKVNSDASLNGALPWNPLQGRVITSWIDTRNSSTATLYGNDIAVDYARSNSAHVYPAGAILALVTWSQKEDERWFGARIPAAYQSVEYVTVGRTVKGVTEYSYKRFQGNPLRQTQVAEGETPNDRATYLLSQRAAVMP